MVVHKNPSYCLFLLMALSFVVAISDSESDSNLIHELISLRSAADSGVIRLNDDGVSRFITSVSTPRPYSLIIFFYTGYLPRQGQLRLEEFRREFGIVSTSYISNKNGSNGTKLFFIEIDYANSKASFQRFGVISLPHVSLVDPFMENLQEESSQMEEPDFSGMAESMAKFIERKTKLTIGPIERPPFLTKIQISVIITLIVILTPILIKQILKWKTLLHDKRLYLCGAVFVYFFSVSGTMYNIIKDVPMFVRDHEEQNKFVFFYEGPDMQFGAEGYTIGFLYTLVGLLLAFVTNFLVHVKDLNEQRLIMLLSLTMSFMAIKKVVYLDNWKTGYEIHPFWPSWWQ